VIGIFQHVWAGSFPTVHPRTHVALRVQGRRTEIGDHRVRVRFEAPDGSTVVGSEGTMQFGEPAAGIQEVEASAILAFDVPLPTAGRYWCIVEIDGAEAVRTPLTATHMEPPGVRPPPG